MKLAAHLGLEGFVDDLMLLHPRLAAKALGQHGGGIVVAIAGQIADRHLGIRYARLDEPLDIAGSHGHWRSPIKPMSEQADRRGPLRTSRRTCRPAASPRR